MNVADSELVMSILGKEQHTAAASIDEADVIIFNTCSVRQHAEDRVLGRISAEMTRKRQKPHMKIGVIGCMAQRLGDKLHQMNKGIDFVVGVDQYQQLPAIIYGLEQKEDFVTATAVNHNETYNNLYPVHTGDFNAFVTIMRGCNNFCSYCIVPYTRGRERSRPVEEILQEVREVGEKGFRDVTLLGQNVNSYHYRDVDFPELLRRVNEISSIRRIRFVTSHPKDLSDNLISTMASCEKVCEHAHIAMQSGDNAILKRMNRGYTFEHFLDIAAKLRKAMPGFALTTDIIAGFPGETEEQFMATYHAMEAIEFDYAFTFKYSPRTGTKAAAFTDQVPEAVRLERLQRLIELQQDITLRKYQEQTGTIKEIYVEKVSKKSDKEVAGKSRDFKITVFPGTSDLIGKFVKVRIVDAVGWTLKGEMIEVVDG